jgi:hypothetical protein
MAQRDLTILPQDFLHLMLAIKRRQLMVPGSDPVVTVVAGCTAYLLRPHEAGRGCTMDASARLAAWAGHRQAVSQ